jgi:malate dehydrogenase
MARKKIALIGAGNIGGELAALSARRELGDVVLLDIPEKAGVAKGKALDLMQACALDGADAHIRGTSDYGDIQGADVCIVTAGLPRKPGMSRDDLLAKNASIVRGVTEQFVAGSPDAILVVVSNPLDVMTYVAYMTSGFPSQRVMGMAGVLDTARYRAFIAMELGVSVRDIQAMLLGGHGDTMVPLPRYTTVAGTPLTDLLSKAKIDEIVERTKFGGGEIVKLMGTSAWYAPGAASAEMVEAIIKDNNRVLPAAAWCTGQYGLDGLFIGVPVRLGRNGVEEIIEIELDREERQLLEDSAAHVRESVEALERVEAAQSA